MKKILNWFCVGIDPEILRLQIEAEAILRTINKIEHSKMVMDGKSMV